MNDKILNLLKNGMCDENIEKYVELIKECWDNQYGSAKYNNGVLELHTGGWSENEEILSAIQMNKNFWWKYWTVVTRGGHYWFVIRDTLRSPIIKWEKETKKK